MVIYPYSGKAAEKNVVDIVSVGKTRKLYVVHDGYDCCVSYLDLIKGIDSGIEWVYFNTNGNVGEYYYIGVKDSNYYIVDVYHGADATNDRLKMCGDDIFRLQALQQRLKDEIVGFTSLGAMCAWIRRESKWSASDRQKVLRFVEVNFGDGKDFEKIFGSSNIVVEEIERIKKSEKCEKKSELCEILCKNMSFEEICDAILQYFS